MAEVSGETSVPDASASESLMSKGTPLASADDFALHANVLASVCDWGAAIISTIEGDLLDYWLAACACSVRVDG